MAKRNIPTHTEGWKFAGSAGRRGVVFNVWYAGYMDYRVATTDGTVVASARQLGEAHMRASKLVDIELSKIDYPEVWGEVVA